MLEPSVSINKNLNNSLGNLLSFEESEYGLFGKTDNAQFRVLTYARGIVRIQISFDNDFESDTYAMVANPASEIATIEDQGDKILLSTSNVNLLIKKAPVRFSFYTPAGELINTDDESFGTSRIGDQLTTYKTLQPNERFIGLGEKTGPLDRRGHGYQHWNTDHFGYPPDGDPLYCSTPFYIGIHSNLAYGIYFDNSHKSHFNFGASNNRFSSFSADGGDMNYYFIYEGSISEIISSYSHLTGRMPLPPKWSLGYQQCRYSYYPDKEVLSVAQTFRDKDIPADVIVLDIHYMDKYKIFTWDEERFASPESMVKELKAKGFHVVVMCDPGIKTEEGYTPYHTGKEEDIFLKYPDGSNYSGEVWPGWCHFPDFTSEKARSWWKDNLKAYTDIGVDGYWNDMNEIATWGQMLPELIEFDFEGERATARKGRNIYGMQMAKSTYEATKDLMGKRPFNLTRSGFSGIQRYAAVWTGDNVASDEHMMLGVRLVNSMGLAGIPFAGYDVGGFVGNASEHLFARWVQIGAFSPFFRGHSMINSRDSEPWAYGEEVEEISRNYIKLRYKLMPYLYELFRQAAASGVPIARSLAIDHPHEELVFDERFQNQYMLGPEILVAPVESTKDMAKVFLPKGNWYEFFTDEPLKGNQIHKAECPIEQLPLFVKGSSILPMYSQAGSHVGETGEILELHIYKGEDKNAFTYYEDDGESYEFESGNYFKKEITYAPADQHITIGKKVGKYSSAIKTIQVFFHGFESLSPAIDGKEVKIKTGGYEFLSAISNFDPLGTDKEHILKINNIQSLSIENHDEEVSISW